MCVYMYVYYVVCILYSMYTTYVYVYMYVCMCVQLYLRVCMCMYVYVCVCVYVRMRVCVYLCMYVCMYVGMLVCRYVFTYVCVLVCRVCSPQRTYVFNIKAPIDNLNAERHSRPLDPFRRVVDHLQSDRAIVPVSESSRGA
jgi:hypothetical protein